MATDSDGLTDTEVVTITVQDENESPVLASITPASVDENQTNVQIGSVSWTDPDNADNISTDVDYDNVLVSLGGADATSFTLDASDNIIFVGPADYEIDQKTYLVDVIATDEGDLTDTLPLTISVDNVNENPVIESETGTLATPINEGDTAIYTASATDELSLIHI